ncbi:DUF3304 domain-containing protein [Pseudoduganella sp. LjRoot289]|uniref:DUF3304 domain-containing protein n=1 Tax=Pseudoduganella sp. LjRoot289 TaxID=3342314 RepID=UPI003ECEBE2D
MMMDMNTGSLFRSIAKRALLVCLLATPAVFALAKSTISVSVHGVNYSNETFSFSVEDPNDNKGPSAGELVDRFAAGGTVCCYDLPKEWQPGIKIKVNSVHWLKETADKKLPEVKQVFVVEVPPYVDGKPGELWVLRQPDGTVDVVSSDYQPNHEKWPGKVKGWPVPSLEYRRERWALFLSLAESDVRSSKQALSNLAENPEKYSGVAWALGEKYRRKDIARFSGPTDPNFIRWLQESYEANLSAGEAKVKTLREAKP